jgi:hypothetical protein
MRTAQTSTNRQDSVGAAFWFPRSALPLAFLLALAGGAAASVDGPDSDGEDAAKDGLWPANFRTASEAVATPAALRRFAFVENLGQWNTPASFVANLGTTVVQVQESGFAVDACPEESDERVLLRFEFERARDGVEPVGEGQLPGVRNYLLGNDPKRWRSGAKSFAQVVYPGLYGGVDLRLREGGGVLEYDLYLVPGADLSQVIVRCEGVSDLEVDEQGGLLMHSAQGVLRQSPPVTWCVLPSGEREPLECEFVVLDGARFGFRLAEHDAGLPVVIDPGLEWATYLGGSGSDWILGMDRNSQGQIVLAGTTLSPDFPTKVGPAYSGGHDVFVSVLDATGSSLVSSTLLGGTKTDLASDIQLDSNGDVYVVGLTASSTDFPTTSGAWQPTWGGGNWDGFLVVLPPSLSKVDYGSFVGGSDFDNAGGLWLRAPRVLTIVGSTRSVDFPGVTPATAVQPNNAGGNSDYFLCRLDLDQPSPLQYGTYLGGSAGDGETIGSISVFHDPQIHETAAGVVMLAGRTKSSDIVRTLAGYDTSFNSASSADHDAYLAIVDPSQSGSLGLVYDSYLGGELREAARALAVDSAGVITLGGWTDSLGFPTSPGAFGTEFVGPFPGHDGFITRLDPGQGPGGPQLLYSTLLAGDGFENVTDLALDSSGRVVAQGYTGDVGLATNRFPTTCDAFQPSYAGQNDGYLVWLDPAGNGASDLLYSTFLGGTIWDIRLFGLEILSESPTLRVLSAGGSGMAGFPWKIPGTPYQPNPAGVEDGFVLQLEIDPNPSCVNPSSYCTAGTSASGCTATLSAAGNASATAPSGFVLTASDVEGAKDGLFFFGTSGRQTNSWGNGTSLQCVIPPVRRGGLLTGVGTAGQCDGTFSQDMNARWCPTCPKPLQNPGAGAVVQAQLWYRDPFNTSNQTTSLSDAIEFVVEP